MSKYERRSSQIRELANNPNLNATAEVFTKGTHGLHEIAPNISQSLQTTGGRALQYLNAKLPKPVSELIGDQEHEPSKTEKREWMGAHDLVNDPISVLDHVRHGTLTPHHMEALTQVHPELLDEMRQKVMEHMEPSKVKKLPSTTKSALGLFLGSPVSEAHTTQSIMMNQMSLQTNQAALQQQKGPKSTEGGLKELKLGQRSQTGTDRTEIDT